MESELLPEGGYADAYFGLREALEDLFGRQVDLVASSAVRNPYIKADIERTRTLLYASVERQFEIIGETLGRLVKVDPEAAEPDQ